MSFRLLAGFSALVMSMMCGQSVAAEKKEYTSHIGITGEYHDLHFVEIRDGEPVNEEKGSLLFNGGIFHWQWASGLLTEVSFKQAEDTLAYNGYTQLGRFVTTTTEYYISDFSFVLGRSFGATSAYVGVNMHYRERNILGVPDMNVSGLYEELDTTNGVLGFRAALFRHNPLQLRLEARIATGLDSSLYFNDGDLDPATITPGRQNSYRIAAEILYNPFSRIVVSLIPAYEYTRIDKSSAYMTYIDGSPTGHTSFLPQTEWESYSITGKLSWYF